MSIFSRSVISCIAATASVCGIGATASASFSYGFFFGQPSDVTFNGSAVFNNEVRLTTGGGQSGAMWHQTKQNVSNGFITEFRFRMDPGPINLWGDGFAFVLQDSSSGVDALGEGGSGIGYSGIDRSIAVEFDTFTFGGEFEFAAPHVSIQSNGTDANGNDDSYSLGHVVLSDIGVDILDYADHTALVQYRPPNIDSGTPGLMQVYIDYHLVLEVNVDLQNVRFPGDSILDENGQAIAGITAATGLADSTHAFGAWAFNEDTGECSAPYWYIGGAGWGGPGGDFGMGAEYSGSMPMTFTWYKDGAPIADDDGGRITGLSSNQIHITNIQMPDAGHYWVTATNDCGESQSFDFGLRVCPSNFNCDGVIDFFDYLDFVDAFAANEGAADFNFDNVIDFFDYLDFVDAFSSGC